MTLRTYLEPHPHQSVRVFSCPIPGNQIRTPCVCGNMLSFAWALMHVPWQLMFSERLFVYKVILGFLSLIFHPNTSSENTNSEKCISEDGRVFARIEQSFIFFWLQIPFENHMKASDSLSRTITYKKKMLPMSFQTHLRPLQFTRGPRIQVKNPYSKMRDILFVDKTSESLLKRGIPFLWPPRFFSLLFYLTPVGTVQVLLSFPFLSSSLSWPPRILSVRMTIINLTKWFYRFVSPVWLPTASEQGLCWVCCFCTRT